MESFKEVDEHVPNLHFRFSDFTVPPEQLLLKAVILKAQNKMG
jgi:hypothetical protein